MLASKNQIRETVIRLINNCGRSPYLFVGSGFSRRYMGTDNWEGLLRSICMELWEDEFRLDSYLAQVKTGSKNIELPAVASMIEKDLRVAVFNDAKLATFRDKHAADIRARKSLLKIFAAQRLKMFSASNLLEELEILKSAGQRKVSGVITTNYDNLLESVFPGFHVFVGQDDLLFHKTYELGEIYKIHGSMDNPETMILNEADYEKLTRTQEYLAAKLLTIFMEYPIIFIGYSLSDPDIQAILQSIAHCLGPNHIAALRDRFIFICRGENGISSHSITYPSIGDIEMTKITVNDFGIVYEAIAQSECSFSPKVLRELRRNIYEMVEGSNPNGRLIVDAGFSDLDNIPENASCVLGVGVPNSSAGYGYMIKAEHLYLDVILDDQHLSPKLVVEEYLPNLLRSNSGGLPMFKYLSAYSGDAFDPRVAQEIEEKDCLDAFLNKALIQTKRSYGDRCPEKSVSAVIHTEGEEHAYKKLVLLEEDEIDISELRQYLSKLIKPNPKILSSNSELKRLIRIYDFLKYKKASNTSANSGNSTCHL